MAPALALALFLCATELSAQNQVPVVTVTPLRRTVRVNRPVALTATASDGDQDPLVCRWSRAAGPEGEFSDAAALITTYTPNMVGMHDLVFSADDGRGGVTTASVCLLVQMPGVLGDAIISTFAGDGTIGCIGDGGPPAATQVYWPYDIAVAARTGDVYISANCVACVRKVDAATNTVVEVKRMISDCCTGLGGPAELAGIGFTRQLWLDAFEPCALFYSAGNRTVLRQDLCTGLISSVAGRGPEGFSGDGGQASLALVHTPRGFQRSLAGDFWWLADSCNNRIRRVDSATGIIDTVLGRDTGVRAVGSVIPAPTEVVFDGQGNWFYAVNGGHRIWQVNGVTGLMTSVAGQGYGSENNVPNEGTPASASNLYGPISAILDGQGSLYVADTRHHRVKRIDLATGICHLTAGTGAGGNGGDGGPALSATITQPTGLALDTDRNLYVADYEYARIRRISLDSGIITSYAATTRGGTTSGDGGPALQATFRCRSLGALAMSTDDSLLICDVLENRVRKVDRATGIITTIAGTGANASGPNGLTATQTALSHPDGVAMSTSGDLYVAEKDGHRVRRIDGITRLVSTVAGTGVAASTGDTGRATEAAINGPWRITFDPQGRLLIPECYGARIRRVDLTDGTITTIAGGFDDVPASATNLAGPVGLWLVEEAGKVLFTDGSDRVRCFETQTGIVSTVAGAGQQSSAGDGGPAVAAKLSNPADLARDCDGNLYISEYGGSRVRRIDAATGRIESVVGMGTSAYGGDGNRASAASLVAPYGLTLDWFGNLYIADWGGHRVRRVSQNAGRVANLPPHPDAGPDLAATVGTAVALDGRRSSDPDADLLQVQWAQLSGPSCALANATTLVASVTLTTTGLYEFGLTASDGQGGEKTDRVRVTVLPGEPLRIAYRSARSGSSELWTIRSDGGSARQLTNDAFVEVLPRWSPDRRRLAFISDSSGAPRVWVMNSDGSGKVMVAEEDAAADQGLAWHPDGRRVVFGSGAAYCIASADDSGVTTAFAAVADLEPAGGLDFCPDGKHVLLGFASPGDASSGAIYRASAEGGTPTLLVDRPGAADRAPVVSPDGASVLFQSADAGGKSDLFVASAVTGAVASRLTSTPAVAESAPRFYPDGSGFLYVSDEYGNLEVFNARSDGSGALRVTANSVLDDSPDLGFPLLPNQAPLAIAVPPPAGTAGVALELDGSRSFDPNGEPIAYRWQVLSAPGAGRFSGQSETTTATPSFTGDTPGTYTLRLTVTDLRGARGTTDLAVIQRSPDIVPPTATLSFAPSSPVTVPTTVTVTAIFSEPLRSPPVLAFARVLGTGALAGGPMTRVTSTNIYVFEFMASTSNSGTFVALLTAADLAGNALVRQPEVDALVLDVRVNSRPVASAGAAATVEVDTLVVLDATASSDPDGDRLTYTWTRVSGPVVTLSDPHAARPAFVPREVGTYVFSVTVSDGRGGTAEASVRITVAPALPDLVVEAVQAPETVVAGDALTAGASVVNRGAATAAAPFDAAFYLSAGSTLDTSAAVGLGPSAVREQLGPGERAFLVGSDLLVPANQQPGCYRIFARVDPAGTVAESNEENNSLASTTPTTVQSAVGDDHPDAAALTGPGDTLTAGGLPVAGRLGAPGDVDWFRFQAAAQTRYLVETQVQTTDTVLQLLDRDGTTVLGFNDDATSGSLFSWLEFVPQFTATYFIEVSHKLPSGTGAYGVRLGLANAAVTDDHPNFTFAAGPADLLTPGAGVTATFETTGDLDVFRFTGTPGSLYQVAVASTLLAALAVELFDVNGATVLQSVAATGGRTATLTGFRPRVPGVYFLRISGGTQAGAGAYSVLLVESSEALGAPPALHVSEMVVAATLDAALRTEGTSLPLSSLQLLVTYDRGRMRFRNPTYGPAASAFNPSVDQFLPPFLPVSFLTQTPTPLPPGLLVTLAFDLSGNALEEGSVGVLSATVTDPSTQVTVVRPTAHAGLPREVDAGRGSGGEPAPTIRDPLDLEGPLVTFVRLDGRLSFDPVGRKLTYRWTQPAGPAHLTLSDPSAPTPTFAPGPDGFYEFALVVGNGVFESPPARVRIGVNRQLHAPSALARIVEPVSGRSSGPGEPPLQLDLGQLVVLDAGTSSDPDDLDRGTLTYLWSQEAGPAVSLPGTASGVATAAVRVAAAGSYAFRVQVQDGGGLMARSNTVRAVARETGNTPPTLSLVATATGTAAWGADLGEDAELAGGPVLRVRAPATITVRARVQDPDVGFPPLDQRLSFFWRQVEGPAVEFAQAGAENEVEPRSSIAFAPRSFRVHGFECQVRELSSTGQPTGIEVTRRIRIIVDTPSHTVPEARLQVGPGKTADPHFAQAETSIAAVEPGQTVELDGSDSRRPGSSGVSLRYQWVQVAGPAAILSNPFAPVTTFVAPDLPGEGSRLVLLQLFVDDGVAQSAPATVAVDVRASAPGMKAWVVLEQGLSLISVPVDPSVTGHCYNVADLAKATGASMVIRSARGDNGRLRQESWMVGAASSPWPIEGNEAYLLIRPGPSRQVEFRGTQWPPSSRTRTLLPGLNFVGLPGEVPLGQTTAALFSSSPASVGFVARPIRSGPGRLDWLVHLPQFTPPLSMRTGQGWLVSATGQMKP